MSRSKKQRIIINISFLPIAKQQTPFATFIVIVLNTESISRTICSLIGRHLFCLERCVPQAERDAHFVSDVSFGSDVRFAHEDAEHITSLCDEGAKHRCASARHHYGEAITSLFTSVPKCAIIHLTQASNDRKAVGI